MSDAVREARRWEWQGEGVSGAVRGREGARRWRSERHGERKGGWIDERERRPMTTRWRRVAAASRSESEGEGGGWT